MIYLVEDDESIRELVSYALNKTGHSSVGFSTADELYSAIERELPSLVLLDVMLPGEDGLSILSRLRSTPATADLPIIMLTAKGSEFDKVTALDMGADDYVVKPFGVMELVARVQALLRRAARGATRDGDTYTVGGITLSVARHEVRVFGSPVCLTLKEFELLALLLVNKGTVLTRDGILSEVWGYDFDGESRTVDVHIRTLRQKLGDCGEYIETVRGVGYKVPAEIK